MKWIKLDDAKTNLNFYSDTAVYGDKGSFNNFLNYIDDISPEKIKTVNGETLISDDVFDNEYIMTYLKKESDDYSASDIAESVLHGRGIPPRYAMSVASLERKIRDIFLEYKDNVYFKRVQNKNTACVNYEIEAKIKNHPDLRALLKKQIEKAERKYKDSHDPKWRAYESDIDNIKAIRSSDDDESDYIYLSDKDELFIKTNAIYNLLFTEFDTKKYNDLYNEWLGLEESENKHSERWLELRDLFLNSPDYNYEFYKPKEKVLDVLVDKIADKISEKIIEKLDEKGS